MIKLKFDKEIIRNHFNYSKLIYLAAIIGALVLVNFIYTTTKPLMPDENKVDIYMYCGYSVNADVESWESEMLSLLPDNQREVNLIASVSAGTQMMEAIIARVAAHEGDMIALDYEQMSALMTNMAFEPLEDYIDIDAITAANPDINWDDYSAADDEGNEHIYMLPLDGVEGLYELGIEPKGNCIAVFFYSKNMDNTFTCLNYIMDKTEFDGELNSK